MGSLLAAAFTTEDTEDRRGPQRPAEEAAPVAPREDSRPLGARAARPLPARHSAGVIAFAALARVVAKSGRAARAARTRPGGVSLWRYGPLARQQAAAVRGDRRQRHSPVAHRQRIARPQLAHRCGSDPV